MDGKSNYLEDIPDMAKRSTKKNQRKALEEALNIAKELQTEKMIPSATSSLIREDMEISELQ